MVKNGGLKSEKNVRLNQVIDIVYYSKIWSKFENLVKVRKFGQNSKI